MIRMITSFFGSGFLPIAPGSWGSLAAIPVAVALYALGGFWLLVAATIGVYALGIWAVGEFTKGMSDPDLSEIVIDEVAGQWLTLWPLAGALWAMESDLWILPWPGLVFGFLFFRFFDIFKLFPANMFDRMKTPFGVMTDDIVAGIYAGITTTIAGALAHGFFA